MPIVGLIVIGVSALPGLLLRFNIVMSRLGEPGTRGNSYEG